jgi:hypothetical protein
MKRKSSKLHSPLHLFKSIYFQGVEINAACEVVNDCKLSEVAIEINKMPGTNPII